MFKNLSVEGGFGEDFEESLRGGEEEKTSDFFERGRSVFSYQNQPHNTFIYTPLMHLPLMFIMHLTKTPNAILTSH